MSGPALNLNQEQVEKIVHDWFAINDIGECRLFIWNDGRLPSTQTKLLINLELEEDGHCDDYDDVITEINQLPGVDCTPPATRD